MALVPQAQELRREVDAVQQLRRTLHDAYIVEAKLGRRSSQAAKEPPPAMDVHRTVDAPTLQTLKAPNYPFTLCEEAPPSYVPPPVPYDVETEVESLKQRVLEVQEAFQAFQAEHGGPNTKLRKEEILAFFGSNTTFAEMAWELSSMHWFYRWILSHSISHLWNCKEQLEYVLTERGQRLPQSTEEMDECLRELPFASAVSVLDTDRQSVVAQERRRLRSVSRTFREALPCPAVFAATSCYLTPEEKYMYQEFFNQSEHMLLLLNHTLMLKRANSAVIKDGQTGRRNSVTGVLSNSATSPRNGGLREESGAVTVPFDSALAEMDTAALTEETVNAVSAEQDVIETLMKTIRERQERGEFFDVSEAEYAHSRRAQIAVYGCVLSDISLMGHQMQLIVEFAEHYEGWLKLRGFKTHEGLMSELSQWSGGTAWPSVYEDELGIGEGGHHHFIPPTEVMMAHHPRPHPDPTGAAARVYEQMDAAGAAAPEETMPSPSHQRAARPASAASSTSGNGASKEPSVRSSVRSSVQRPASSSSGVQDSSKAAAAVPSSPPYLPAPVALPPAPVAQMPASKRSITSSVVSAGAGSGVQAPSDYYSGARGTPSVASDSAASNGQRGEIALALHAILEEASAECQDDGDATSVVSRIWMMASVRYTAIKLLRREWNPETAERDLAQAEEPLLSMLRDNGAFSRLTATAAALCLVLAEFARLCRTRCEMRSMTTEVPVAVHLPSDAGDYAAGVTHVLNPVEQQRWGSVLDALWFQVDPSSAASGGLLLPPPSSFDEDTRKSAASPAGAARFLWIEAINVPAVSARSNAGLMTLHYRLPRMTSSASSSRRVAPTLPTAAAAQSSSQKGIARYHLARCVLLSFAGLEAKGLLPCYACRPKEASTWALAQSMYVTFPAGGSGVVVDAAHPAQMCILPPAAVELKRMYVDLGDATPPRSPKDAAYEAYSVPVNFSTIGLLVGTVLEELSVRVPVLNDLYMTAASCREAALFEIKHLQKPSCFAGASTHPTPISCAPSKTRPMSIQRESVVNRNSGNPLRFVNPLLRHVDDKISSMEQNAESSLRPGSNSGSMRPDGAVVTPRGPPPPQGQEVMNGASVTGRQTALTGSRDADGGPLSLSPSAVRPYRR